MRSIFAAFALCFFLMLLGPTPNNAAEKEDASPKKPDSHFMIVSSAKKPTSEEIARYLEQTWQTFHDVFDVDPAAVKVTINVTPGSGAPSSPSGQERLAGTPQRQMPWSIKEGEALSSQRFSDLSHEITHIYFIDYMEDKGRMHQDHAWLHEAVSCHSEQDSSRKIREQWARDHINDRIPFEQFFTMKNPVKESPLVVLTVKLTEKLNRGEITATEMTQQIASMVAAQSAEQSQERIRHLTYYAQSLSIFEFLLKTEGKEFIRAMSQRLKRGQSMAEIIRGLKAYPQGIPQFEQAWTAWVQAG